MEELYSLLRALLGMLPRMVSDGGFLVFLLLIMVLVYSQYKRALRLEYHVFGRLRDTPLALTMQALGYGLLGGLVATILFVVLGLSLSGAGIIYIFLLAVLLAMLHPRYMCFSYAGGLVSLAHLLFGFPEVHVPVIMALVAVLHLVEALLIRLQGHRLATPVYVKHTNGSVVGGFLMQKFWPLPFVALMAVVMLESAMDFHTLPMPDWWPLMRPAMPVPGGHSMVFFLIPVVAVLGYGDMAVTSSPQAKARLSALYLTVFSFVLLVLALAATRYPWMAWTAALFAPIGHEWVIHRGQRREQERPPVFTTEHGLMVLDVHPYTPAAKMELRPGDVIQSINGSAVNNPKELLEQITPWIIDPVLEVQNMLDGSEVRRIQFKGKLPPVGIIPVPDPNQGGFMGMDGESLITWVQKRLRGGKG